MSATDVQDRAADEAALWVVRLASGDMSDEQIATFESWMEHGTNRLAFERERDLWQALDAGVVRPQGSVLRRLRPSPRVAAWTLLTALAATVVVLATGGSMLTRLQADYRTDPGEVRTFEMADGTSVMLDSDAAIAVHYDRDQRRIELLRGDAWFDVRHGDHRPFRVTAMGGTTQDVGTSFEVRRGAHDILVAVTQGAVQVTTGAHGEPLPVEKLGRVRYDEGGQITRIGDAAPAALAAWRRGIIAIDDMPMSDAIARVAKYRPGATFTLISMDRQPAVSAAFRIDRSDEALQTLADMAGAKLILLPGGVAILR
ncbi:FecR family protein [Novosphingobium resinovorum]|uniref:FecR family protein n=1 Tax=Novosphingobium resinovorum TaxID=158500 RepID=UPI002ED36322|nr:FecR domain-containing protein [Novosphingobium resinovorum]